MTPLGSDGSARAIRDELFSIYGQIQAFPEMPLVIFEQELSKGEDTGLHRHIDFYALYIVRAGRGVHVINGHPYHLVRGDVYIAPPGSVHAYRDYENLRAIVSCFQTDLFSARESAALRSLTGFWSLRVEEEQDQGAPLTIARHRLHLAPERHSEVNGMIEELQREIDGRQSNPTVARTVIPLLFFRLLVTLARAQEAESNVAAVTDHDRGLAQVLQTCEERFAEPLTVAELAAIMFLSPSRFSEVFSAKMGIAPASYLRSLRLQRAQTLLRTGLLPASVVASEVGFNDAAQFSRAFRSAFGITPSNYRAKFGS